MEAFAARQRERPLQQKRPFVATALAAAAAAALVVHRPAWLGPRARLGGARAAGALAGSSGGARGAGWRRPLAACAATAEAELAVLTAGGLDTLPELPPMSERIYLVTGATSGIGRATAERLAAAGSTVILTGRGDTWDLEKPKVLKTMEDMLYMNKEAKLDGFKVDLSIMEDVRMLGDELLRRYPVIHGVLHNAASIDGDFTGRKELSNEGHEMTLAVNAMAPFLLTSMLMPCLERSGAGRFVFSATEYLGDGKGLRDIESVTRRWRGMEQYTSTKLMNVMMAAEMHERYGDAPRLAFHSINPGVVDTKVYRQGAAFGVGPKANRAWMEPKPLWHRGDYGDEWQTGFYRRKEKVPASARQFKSGTVKRPSASQESFRALTHPSFQERSGTSPKTTPDLAFKKKRRRRLWDELVQLTGAEWPEPRGGGARQELAAPGEGQEALALAYGESEEESDGKKIRPGDVEGSELERGPMRLGGYTKGLKGAKRRPEPKITGWIVLNGTIANVKSPDTFGFIIPDDEGVVGEKVAVKATDCDAFGGLVPPEGTRVQFIPRQFKNMLPIGDIENYIKKRYYGQQVGPIGYPVKQREWIHGYGYMYKIKGEEDGAMTDELWAEDEFEGPSAADILAAFPPGDGPGPGPLRSDPEWDAD